MSDPDIDSLSLMRSGMKAVVSDIGKTICRQIDAAADKAALTEIGDRVATMTTLMRPQ
jgi:hypothetical protein